MIWMDDATPNLLRLRWDAGEVTAANFGPLALLNLRGARKLLLATDSFAGLGAWPSQADALAFLSGAQPPRAFILTNFAVSKSSVEWRMRAHSSSFATQPILIS